MSAATLVRDLTAFSIQVALIVAAVAVLVKVVRIPARARYHGLRLALVAALLVPWLLRSPEAPREVAAAAQPALNVLPAPAATVALDPSPLAAAQPRLEIPWLTALLVIVGLGVAVRGLWLVVGLVRLRRMTQTGTVVEEPEYDELQAQIGARATIAQVMGLAQPATFGVRRPVVMLPDALGDAPASLRRAVIIHELFHVRRRDWLFVLAEEMVRTVLWFHPAILWLTSHIQLAREEIVDELTVRATGDRRGYVQALLSFADSGGMSPAPAFAHRRQLFHRILSVSKEKVMSRPRIVLSAVALIIVVCAASGSASSRFPILKAGSAALEPASLLKVQDAAHLVAPVALLADEPVQAPAPARRVEQKPGEVVAPRQVTPENPIPRRTRGVAPVWPPQLARQPLTVVVNMLVTLDRNGAVTNVDRNGCSVYSIRDQASARADAGCNAFYDATATAIRQWRYDRPVQAPLRFRVTVSFAPERQPAVSQVGADDWSQFVRETQERLRLLAEQTSSGRTDEFLRGQMAELTNRLREMERAYRLASERLPPAHPDLTAMQAELARLNEMFAALQRRLNESTLGANGRPTTTSPVDGPSTLRSPSGRAPVRVGGAIRAPRVIKTSKAEYSAEAMRARIEGKVVIEALVDEQGRVADARVVTSLPMLDEAALASAKQWEFTTTLLNGEPVPVLVMIELDFNLR